MESIVKDNILELLMDNNLINPTQHGLKNQFFETITTYFVSGAPADIIYLDFNKAFDKVPKERLLLKLIEHSIEGKVHAEIRDWLTGRKQKDQTENGLLIYINDLDFRVTLISILRKFENNTKCGQRISSDEDSKILQDCLNNLTDTWGMEFHVKNGK